MARSTCQHNLCGIRWTPCTNYVRRQTLRWSFSIAVRKHFCVPCLIHTELISVGSSNGRGPRAAGWFQDVLEKRGNTTTKSVILKGGIKGWFSAGDEYLKFVRGRPQN